MATEDAIATMDHANRAEELARRAEALAWVMAVADDAELPERALQTCAETLAEMIGELARCTEALAKKPTVVPAL